jgi:hypothetical protein
VIVRRRRGEKDRRIEALHVRELRRQFGDFVGCANNEAVALVVV